MNRNNTSRLSWLSTSLAILICLGSNGIIQAQQGFISDTNAETAGLKVAWSTQVGISTKAELVDWELIVDENKSTTYFVIEFGKRREVIAQSDISPFGVPYGVDNAKKAAMNRKEIIELTLKNDGVEEPKVTVTDYTLPKSTILALGRGGQVASINADTGDTNWIQQVGDPGLPSIGLGASKTHIAMASGSTVYCMDLETGRVLWDRPCKYMIDAPPTCSEDNVYVPLSNGKLQVFNIKSYGVDNFTLVAEGDARARPVLTEKSVVWTTGKGHMNVAPRSKSRTVSYRLKTGGPIVSSAAHGMGMLFVGSLDGFVYAVDEQQGRLEWEVSTGQGVSTAPILFGKELYVVSESGQLFKFDAEVGQTAEGWELPVAGISKVVGFGNDTIYCLDERGGLLGIDRETRSITRSVRSSSVELALPNDITDRMFFASKSGFIQCVHEISSIRPRNLATDVALARKAKSQDGDTGEGAGDEANPFGDDSNPLGDDAMEDDSNPFGDDDSDADDDDSNPFGDG